jgi:hypothetical protein
MMPMYETCSKQVIGGLWRLVWSAGMGRKSAPQQERKMKRFVLAVLTIVTVSFVAYEANAQRNCTTTCTTIFGTQHCQTYCY